jgi:ABC-2 type transport system permease protein
LTATRLTRGEEDAGRWELLLTGPTTRARAAAEAVAAMLVGLTALWAVAAMIIVAVGSTSKVGFSVGGSLFLASSLVVGAGTFLALGAVAAQLAANRRRANGLAAAVLAAAYLLRMSADSTPGLEWLRWASPLGWPEELHPLLGPHPAAFLPSVGLIAVSAAVAVALAARRDLGASSLPARDTPPPRTRLLSGPTGLTVRLTLGVATAWVGGLAVLGLVLGLVAQSASGAINGSATVQKAVSRLGGHRGGAAAYLGIAFVIAAAAVAFAAAGQVASTRGEEADGFVDHLLVRPVSRARWLAGRMAVGGVALVAASVVAGLGGWVGAASQHTGVGFGELLQAGVNIATPALFVLGVGTLCYAWWPRVGPRVTYAAVTWSLLAELAASVVKSNRLLVDSSILSHIRPVPAAPADWTAAAGLVGLGVLGGAAAIVSFGRRDLANA